ncbi:MAG: hypothetical protein IT454_12885 [Planctomycetes bacterium]|nr:hypothetical protein [Planctomycetota bacterium]
MAQHGVHDPTTIDLVSRRPDGALVLVMVEQRPWVGSDQRLRELQDKVNAYLSFALDGQMQREFPGSSAQGLVLHLDCAQAPDETVRALLGPLRSALKPLGVSFEVQVLGQATLWSESDTQ